MVMLLYINVWKKKKAGAEHFANDEYEARLEVMKIFDSVLHRKPSIQEIEKYSKYTNEQDILINILNDYTTTRKPQTIEEEETYVVEEEGPVHVDVLKETRDEVVTPLHKENIIRSEPVGSGGASGGAMGSGPGSDKICMNKFYIKQLLDDLQTKIDSVRALLGN
jgi:hypothetical protein